MSRIKSNCGFLPVCLDIRDRKCLVVGGGQVALRKIKVLRKFGASITCLSPEIHGELERLGRAGDIKCVKRGYPRNMSLKKFALVIAATNDAGINKLVAADAHRERTLVNVVDKSAPGSVIMPAIFKRKGLTVSVSTGGRAPSEAKKIRDLLKNAL